MSAMTYGGHFPGGTERKPMTGPLASHVDAELERPIAASFVRPAPEEISEAIPVFFIGRNRDGFWVARDADGKFGGLFWRKEAAIHFARSSASPANCATVFPSERIELDLDNSGNPLLASIGALTRQLIRGVHRLIGAVQAAVRR
jgi:hypothetical protein